MPEHVSPSPVVEVFVRGVRETFPETESAKLVGHEAAIAVSTDRHDGRRARHCARWAISLAGDRDLPHPEWGRIKELHAVWRDITWGAGHAAITEDVGHRRPLKDIEFEWVEDAVHVATLVGEAEGWDQVAWEDLLVELLGMEPGGA